MTGAVLSFGDSSDGSRTGNAEALLELVADLVAARVADRLRPESQNATPIEDWRLLSIAEAAERMGRSTRWVRDRAKRGDLPYVRLDGGALAFDVDDLRAFALARRIPESLAPRLQGRMDTGVRPLVSVCQSEGSDS